MLGHTFKKMNTVQRMFSKYDTMKLEIVDKILENLQIRSN